MQRIAKIKKRHAHMEDVCNQELERLKDVGATGESISASVKFLESLVIDYMVFQTHGDLTLIKNTNLMILAGVGGKDIEDFIQDVVASYEKYILSITKVTINKCILSFNNIGLFKKMILAENLIYKLIRFSPYSKQRRQTSFYKVITRFDSNVSFVLDLSLVLFKYMKSSGAGGQHVNKTNSAVRALHIPSGIDVKVSEDRSQHKNKEIAIKLLTKKITEKSRLLSLKSSEEGYKSQNKIAWSNYSRIIQIDPNKFLKDKITGKIYKINKSANLPVGQLIDDFISYLIYG